MAAPAPSQVHLIHTVQHSFGRLYVAGASTAANIPKKVLDEVQEFLNLRLSQAGLSLDRNEDNVIEREFVPVQRIEQRVPGTYEVNEPLPDGNVTNGGPDINMTDSVPDRLYQQLPEVPEPVRQNGEQELLVSTLTSRVDQLTGENEHLKRSLERANEEALQLTSKLNNATQERDDLGRQRQASLLKIRRLNDMIIKNNQNSDEPLDDEVLQDMFKVRNMTTDVIKRFYPGEATFSSTIAKELTKRFNDPYYSQFYKQDLYPYKNPERRRRLLISLLFLELQTLFFGPNARRFGLSGHMEASLQELEKAIEGSTKVAAEESTEWRTRTVSYVGRLDPSYQETIEKCALRLFTILEPMNLQGEDKHGNPDKKQVAGLSNALQELCSAALKLALRFRSSKTKYEFKAFPDNTSLTACDGELVKKLNSEGPISKPMDPNKLRIFCTLFGALVKTRPTLSGQASDPVVLEPGHVIVYEPQQRGPPQ